MIRPCLLDAQIFFFNQSIFFFIKFWLSFYLYPIKLRFLSQYFGGFYGWLRPWLREKPPSFFALNMTRPPFLKDVLLDIVHHIFSSKSKKTSFTQAYDKIHVHKQAIKGSNRRLQKNTCLSILFQRYSLQSFLEKWTLNKKKIINDKDF